MNGIKRKIGKILLPLTMVFAMTFAMTFASMPTKVFAEDVNTEGSVVVQTKEDENEQTEGNLNTDNVVKPFNSRAVTANVDLIYVNPAYIGGDSDGSEAKPYTSMSNALNNVKDNSTIKLSGDISLEAVTIDDQNLVIDLNGHTWSSNELLKPTILYQGSSGKTLIIKDTTETAEGILSHKEENNAVITVANTGTVEIKSGHLYNDAGIVIANNGTINVSGGKLMASGNSKNSINSQDGSVNISGGTIQTNGSNTAAIGAKGSTAVTITGGKLTTNGGSYNHGINASGNASITVSGGTIQTKGTNCHAIKSFSSGLISISGGTVLATDSTDSNAIDTFYGKSPVKITGGNVGPNLFLSLESGTVKGNNDIDVYKTTLAIPDASNDTDVTGLTYKSGTNDYSYSLVNAKTIEDKFYAYLPLGSATAAFNGKKYNATVTASNDAVFTIFQITDKEKLDEAKPLAQTAITGIIATNSTTAGNILDAVTTGIASVDGVTASWKSAPTITLATKENAGSITGTIVLTCGSETVEVTVNKTIAQLPITNKDKIDEAKPLAESAITALIATNSTTAGNIIDAVTTGIASVDGVTASWKSAPTITLATKENASSITGTIVLTCGSETVEVTVNKMIDKLPTPTPENPTITAGSGSVHQIGDGKDMILTCSGKLDDLTGVYVDSQLVDPSNYTFESGSTILTLKASYLDTLSAGKHTLEFQYKDNLSAETDFTITAKSGVTPPTPISPPTGDTSNTMLYFGLIVLFGCIAGFGFKKKKSLIK